MKHYLTFWSFLFELIYFKCNFEAQFSEKNCQFYSGVFNLMLFSSSSSTKKSVFSTSRAIVCSKSNQETITKTSFFSFSPLLKCWTQVTIKHDIWSSWRCSSPPKKSMNVELIHRLPWLKKNEKTGIGPEYLIKVLSAY